MNERKRASTDYPINFLMVSTIDNKTGVTGLSPTVTINKNGAGWGAPAGAVSDEGNGWYALAGNATDRETLGELLIHAEATGANTVDFKVDIITDDPYGFSADVADAVWDEILTGATHNIATSAGRRLRELAGNIIYSGTCQAGSTSNTIVLDAGASAIDGSYDPSTIALVEGTGAGQCRNILQYDGATRTAAVDRDWKVTPDATSEFIINGNAGREHVNEGLAQGGAANTITLNTLASAADDAYNGQVIFIRSGTGADQVRWVTAYNGTTKVAMVNDTWDTTPDTTSAYCILPAGMQNLSMSDAITAVLTMPGQGDPSATPTLTEALMYLYKIARNKQTFNKTTGVYSLYADDGTTVDQKQTSTDDSTTFTRGELESGA
jgi:hypothetical protein